MSRAEPHAGDGSAPSLDGADAAALLTRLEWTVLRRLDGLLQGDHRTLMRGAGLDLADLREYQHHDDLRHLLGSAARHIKRRSTVFVVSDFISPPGWEAALGQLAMRHEVTAVRLFDPLEMEMPDLGLLTMKDL